MARNMGMEICLSKMGECTEENFETAFPTAGAPIRGQMARGRSQDVTIKVDQQQVFWRSRTDANMMSHTPQNADCFGTHAAEELTPDGRTHSRREAAHTTMILGHRLNLGRKSQLEGSD